MARVRVRFRIRIMIMIMVRVCITAVSQCSTGSLLIITQKQKHWVEVSRGLSHNMIITILCNICTQLDVCIALFFVLWFWLMSLL